MNQNMVNSNMSLSFGILGLKAKTTFKTTGSRGRFLYIVIKAITKDFYTQVNAVAGGGEEGGI